MYGEVGAINMPKKTKSDSKYTENWVPVKTIRNGMILNNRNEFITGVKIQPKNIFILDMDSMSRTVVGLKNFYNTLDFEFWLISADRPVDLNVYRSQLQVLANNTNDQRIRKLIGQDLEKINRFMNNDVVDTEYFILFKEKKMENVQKKIRNMINGLASCGLAASQTSNDDLRVLLDNFLNGNTSYNAGTVLFK